MSYRSMLNKTVTLMRVSASKDGQGIVRGTPAALPIGTHPCAISERSAQAQQGSPQNTGSIGYMLYLLPGVDVRAGDLALVPGVGKLRLAQPYDVRGHHIEVSGVWEGDV